VQAHEPTPSADQRVGRNTTEQLSANWAAHLVDFDGPSFFEYDRVRITNPLVVAAHRALPLGACVIERLTHPLKVVLTAVPFHGRNRSRFYSD